MAENDELDELDEQDDDEQQYDGDDGGAGVVESLMSRLGDNGRSALKPVVSAAAVAAATYVARNGPQLLKELGGDKAREKVGHARERGGVTGLAAGAAKRALSGSGGSLVERLAQGGELGKVADKLSGSGKGGAGWGDGRRLPIMQSVDVAAPVATVYNQWTQFEENNAFLHRVEEVEQRSDATVTWHENIWGLRRAWNAKITEQVPNERIAWRSHAGTGVITFHELAPKLTRVEVVFDWQPTGIVEKLASGLRFHERAAKADLKRFKAFVETRGEETGGWRGRIEEGKVKSQVRNKRKRGADDIPDSARQHSEDEHVSSNGSGDDKQAREQAREERARHRKQRASSR